MTERKQSLTYSNFIATRWNPQPVGPWPRTLPHLTSSNPRMIAPCPGNVHR